MAMQLLFYDPFRMDHVRIKFQHRSDTPSEKPGHSKNGFQRDIS